jgi:outer membrane protein OmpA-like peptidoglycan-associated protein
VRRLLWVSVAALALAAGCKKAEQVYVPPPTRTPVPPPVTDVVAFTREGALWITRSDGNGSSLLAAPGRNQDYWFPSTTADKSGFLAWLSRADGTQDVVHVDLAGHTTVLTETGEQAQPLMKNLSLGNAPSASPDGTHIAYSFNGNLWIMDSGGYNAETLINDGASWSPAYSPDGKQIAYVNGRDGHMDLWIADVSSKDTYQVTDFSEYSVGSPRWSPSGERIVLTRTQGELSDIVEVTAKVDTPAADSDVLTKDHLSAGAVFSPNGASILFSSARADSLTWDLYTPDATGNSVRQITQGGGLSPDWMQPATATSAALVFTPSKPTPTAVPAPSAPLPPPIPPAPKAAAPQALPTSAPVPAAPQATASTAPAAAPAAPAAAAAAGASKNASLRLMFRASFDAKDKLDMVTLANLRRVAARVKQYAGEPFVVVGPLDNAPLKGHYPSNEARSKARAKSVAAELVRMADLDPATVKAEQNSPPTAGKFTGIQIYVVMPK